MASVDQAPSSASGLPPQSSSSGRETSRLAPPTRHSTRQLSQLSRDGTGSLSSSLLQPSSAAGQRERTLGQLPPSLAEEGTERATSSVSSMGSMIGFPDEQEFAQQMAVLREDMRQSLQKSQQWRLNFQQRSESVVQRVRRLAQRRLKPAHAQTSPGARAEVQGGRLPTPDGNDDELPDTPPTERVVEGGDFTPEAIT